MMRRIDTPTARQVRFGRMIKELREQTGASQEAVSHAAGFSESKMNRIESGRVGISEADLEKLLTTLKAGPQHAEYIRELRAKGKVAGWEADVRNAVGADYADYIGYEGDAYQAFNLETTLIPGLLQTPEYAAAAIRYPVELSSPEAVKQRLEIKAKRQEVFDKKNPLKLWAIISESVLRHNIGGTAVMKAQLRHLLKLAVEYENIISIQVLPEDSPAHAGLFGPYMILKFRERWEPDIVYIESLADTRWIEREDKVRDYTEQFHTLMAHEAQGRGPSLGLIQEYADRL